MRMLILQFCGFIQPRVGRIVRWGLTVLASGMLLSPASGAHAAAGVIERYAGSGARVVWETLPGGGGT